jgi:hypothetical protein
MEQPTTKLEVFAMNALALNTLPLSLQQHQAIEIQEDQQQDSKKEIEATIEDELVCLRQENECLRLM